jgi:hypothetical protein
MRLRMIKGLPGMPMEQTIRRSISSSLPVGHTRPDSASANNADTLAPIERSNLFRFKFLEHPPMNT